MIEFDDELCLVVVIAALLQKMFSAARNESFYFWYLLAGILRQFENLIHRFLTFGRGKVARGVDAGDEKIRRRCRVDDAKRLLHFAWRNAFALQEKDAWLRQRTTGFVKGDAGKICSAGHRWQRTVFTKVIVRAMRFVDENGHVVGMGKSS